MPISTNLVHRNMLPVHWKTYCGGAKEKGLPEPDGSMWRVSRTVYIGESNDEAWDHVRNGRFKTSFDYLIAVLTALKFLSLVKADPDMPDKDVSTEYLLKKVCIMPRRWRTLELGPLAFCQGIRRPACRSAFP